MKIQIASDIHREFFPPRILLKDEQLTSGLHSPYYPIEVTDADVLVLAGDIGAGPDHAGTEWAYEVFRDHYDRIVVIQGNHEGYGATPDIYDGRSKQCHVIGDVVIVTATLWTDFDLNNQRMKSMDLARHMMSDYHRCKGLTPERVWAEHISDVAFITDKLRTYKNKKKVVVTHHLPSPEAIHPKWRNAHPQDHANSWYASDLSWIMRVHKPVLWIHGHTHESMDSVIDGCRVICNPFGYWNYETNPEFNPRLVVEV